MNECTVLKQNACRELWNMSLTSANVRPHRALNTRLGGWESVLGVMKARESCEQGRDRIDAGVRKTPLEPCG